MASSVESTTSKRKTSDVGWEYGTLPDKKILTKVQCTLCNKVMSGGIHRLKQHIAGITGNVQACPKATPGDVLKCKKALDELFVKKKCKQDHREDVRRDVRTDSENHIDLDGMEEAFGGMKLPHTYGPMHKFTTSEKGKGKQTGLDHVMRKEKEDRLNDYCARWAFQHAIPFNAIDNDEFNAMLEAAGQYGPWAKGPTRYQLGEPLLKKELDRTKTRMKIYEDEWKTNGCSIMTDGWTDTKRRSILNLCVNSKSGTVFLSSKESSDESHTGDLIYQYVEGCIQQVGPENVVQVVTDNASNNMAAAKILKTKRPKIFWTSCAAHSINLALEGIGNLKAYKQTLESARKITVYIYAHHKSLALMRKYTKKRDIVRPGVTRFASAFLTLQSLLEKRVQLRQMFMSAQWEACNHSKTKKGKEICELVIANKTWHGVTRCLSVFEPLVKVLRMVDADWKPSMGFLYGELKRAKQQIKDVLKNNNELYSEIMQIISAKTDGRLDSCLHLAAYVLNPYYFYHDLSIQHDGRANDAVVEVIETLFPDDITMQLRIVNDELPIYKERQGKFSRVIAIKRCEVNNDRYDPASWWSNYGGETPNLRIVAMRLLSLTTSSSGCERNWSTFEAIHTKKRNRLEANKVNNLVYIQFNANLISKNERRKERVNRDVLLSNESATEAQDWILDEGLTYDSIGDNMGVNTRELYEDFESENEEEEVDDEFEYESDGCEILERHYDNDFNVDEE